MKKQEPIITHKILATEFKGRASQKEFNFKQLKREGMIAIYEKVSPDSTHYETIVIQKHDGRTMPGNVEVPPSEFYPGENTWGLSGWTHQTLERAEEKFNELINR